MTVDKKFDGGDRYVGQWKEGLVIRLCTRLMSCTACAAFNQILSTAARRRGQVCLDRPKHI